MSAQHKGPIRFRVVESEQGTRLATLVARRLGDLDPAHARDLVRAGAVYVGHLRVRVPSVRVVPGERITVYPEALQHRELPASAVRFVHRDDAFVVLDKPAGVPVAQTKQSARGTLAEALRRVLVQEGMLRPYVGLVHRLDREASGLVVFSIRDVANQSLHAQFQHHRIDRRYRLLVRGDAPASWTCELPIAETGDGRSRVAEAGEPRAKPARTMFSRLRAEVPEPGTSLLEASLDTGRMHQIRVHAAAHELPVVGDATYGDHEPAERMMLHAWRLLLEHPLTGEPIVVEGTLPPWARGEPALGV